MTMCIAIDPGISTGWARYEAGVLRACGAVSELNEMPWTFTRGGISARVLIECPQVYPHGGVDPNNLITLAVRVGRYQEWFESRDAIVELVLPRVWKGQLTKNTHHPRIYGALSSAEQGVVADAGNWMSVKAREDMLDAVGLAQWATRHKKWPFAKGEVTLRRA